MPELKGQSSPLSVQGAFVMHFRLNSEVACGELAGRVEHIASRQLAYFTSVEELMAFVKRTLTSVRPVSPEEA